MRSNIDSSPRNIKDVLMDDRIRKEFLSGAPKKDSKVVSAFISNNSENALKTKPKVRSMSFCCVPLFDVATKHVLGRWPSLRVSSTARSNDSCHLPCRHLLFPSSKTNKPQGMPSELYGRKRWLSLVF